MKRSRGRTSNTIDFVAKGKRKPKMPDVDHLFSDFSG